MKFNSIFSLIIIFISITLTGCSINPSSNDNINDDSTAAVKPLSNDNINEDATATVTLDTPIFAAPSGYIQGTGDEFNGSLSSIWQANYLKHRTTDAASAARYSFSSGVLVLRIDKDTPVYSSSIDSNMKVSSIQTGEKTNLHKTGIRSVSTFEGFKQQYGYFEVRAMHQKGSGNHVAFW